MTMPCFAKVELREGRITATTNRGDVYDFCVNWDNRPEIRLLKRGYGFVEDAAVGQCAGTEGKDG